jgi:uncharacterized protein
MRIEVADGWVDLERPRGAWALLLLTHGANGAVATKDLLAVRDAALAAGLAVGLITQPFRVAGRRTPPAAAVQDEAWLAMLHGLRRRRGSLPLIVGGRSNGARVACRTADASGAVAVVGLAFPLHPPGRPDKSRLDELELPSVPVLVVQGERDPFGMPPSGANRTVVVVEGADHSLRKGLGAIGATVADFVTSTLAHASVEQ